MLTVYAKLKGHELSLVSSPTLASDSNLFDIVNFDFDEHWDGFFKTALFWGAGDETPYSSIVDESGNATIPSEVLAERSTIRFGVFGESEDLSTVITSTILKYKIQEGAWSDFEIADEDVTQSLVERLKMAAYAAVINATRAAELAQQASTEAAVAAQNASAASDDADSAAADASSAGASASAAEASAAATAEASIAAQLAAESALTNLNNLGASLTSNYADIMAEVNRFISVTEASVAGIVGKLPDVARKTIWEAEAADSLIAEGDFITLTDDLTEYDYVEFSVYNNGKRETFRFEPTFPIKISSAAIRPSTTAASSSYLELSVFDIYLNFGNGTLSVTKCYGITVDTGQYAYHTYNASNRTTNTLFRVDKIVGWKYSTSATDTSLKDNELVDIRTGYDGTAYSSAGSAVRGQIGLMKDYIDDEIGGFNDDLSDLLSQSNHTERGFDIDKSAFGLGYKSAINTAFVVGGINSSTGALQRTTLSRARTGYLYLDGAYRIRNLSNGRLSIQIARVTIGSGYTVPVAYTTDANVDYTFSSDYAYVIVVKDTQYETTMSSEALALCNNLIVITSGTMSMDDIQPLSHKSNMFVGYADGNANPTSGDINTNAEYKHTDYIPVKPGEKYSVTSDYCNICFYDYSKVFVSGIAINNGSYTAIGTRENPYVVVTVPDKAAFVVFATYRGEYDRQVVTRLPGATPYPAVYDLSTQLIPERNIVRDKSACLYDANLEKLTMYPSTWLAGYTAANWTAGTGLRMTSGTVRPYMYTTMEKSKISAIFTMSANGEIRFGYDSSNSAIGDSTTDSMVVCVIDSSAKTITMKRWNWSGDMGATLASESFNFTLTNGHKYCISIEKNGVYHTTARLYDCDCPGEVAVAEYKNTYVETDETVNGFCRAWGCGRFTVASGTVVLKRFSMWSTGNAHPKMYIVGDSFVEHAGRNRLCGWPQRLYDATKGDAFLSGRGGATAANVLKRLPFELNVCHSQYGIVEIGTNDSVSSSSDVSTFKTQIQTIISVLERENIIPVLVTISRRTDTDNLTFIQEVNPWIRSLGYLYIDEALAMSTGDGVTQDPAKYQIDGIHPSIAGGAAVYEWIEANLPELIY